jgi:acyl-CoA thioesterase II
LGKRPPAGASFSSLGLTAGSTALAIDLFHLHATEEPTRFSWRPSEVLFTPTGTLQGGGGLGAAIAAMEVVTSRPLVWATAQYLTYAAGSAPLNLDVTVEVAGQNTTQARCVLSRDGTEILTAHAALGARKSEVEGVWCHPPEVPSPDTCEPYRYFEPEQGGLGALAELRLARGRQLADVGTGRGDGSSAWWIRCWKGRRFVTATDLAFLGDFMPLAFADALGAPYAGNSIDNTVRIGQPAETEWVLLSATVHQVVNGFGHGRAELWTDDGTLLCSVSQTAVMRANKRMREREPGAESAVG